MKKLTLIACIVLVFAAGLLYFKSHTVVDIGKSTRFSKAEVQTAVDCVVTNFKSNFKGCDLLKIWYDENESDGEIVSYMTFGRGSINGVKKENVIVLFSDFYVNPNGGDGSLNQNSIYSDFNWVLIRDSKTGNWRIDDSGY